MVVDDPEVSARDRPICTKLMGNLPSQVLDESRRKVEPGQFGAAWGSPAITLRCGIAKPASLNSASACFEVNGVGWFVEQASGGYLFTTIGRRTYVEVGVPAEYAPEGSALVDVADAVSEHDPLDKPCA